MSDYGTHGEPNTLRLERILPGPIERVWEYLTDSDKRARWFAPGTIELRAGGRVHLVADNAKLSGGETPEQYKCKSPVMRGEVLECDPPRLLRYRWDHDGAEPSDVTFELTPQGKDVRLVLTHRRVLTRGLLVGVSSGWHTHIGLLGAILRGETPEPFWPTFEQLKSEYEKRIPG